MLLWKSLSSSGLVAPEDAGRHLSLEVRWVTLVLGSSAVSLQAGVEWSTHAGGGVYELLCPT